MSLMGDSSNWGSRQLWGDLLKSAGTAITSIDQSPFGRAAQTGLEVLQNASADRRKREEAARFEDYMDTITAAGSKGIPMPDGEPLVLSDNQIQLLRALPYQHQVDFMSELLRAHGANWPG